MHGKHILVADTDTKFVEELARQCHELGLTVRTAHDAMTALKKMHAFPPDLLWIDVDLPRGGGFGLCEMVGGDDCLSGISIVVATHRTDEATQQRCRQVGAHYLHKTSELWPRLGQLLGAFFERKGKECQSNDASSPGHKPQSQPKILCIDDDPDFSSALKFRLERYGARVIQAFNGMQGYWTCLDSKPDVIITDMKMPEGEGNYIFGRLRQNPITKDIPVIVVSGQTNPGLKRLMLSLGVSKYLTKPFDFEELLDELCHHVMLSPTAEKPAAADFPEEAEELVH